MISPQKLLEVAFLCMACLSGLLLSVSLGSSHYFIVGGLGAALALLLVDWLGWFRMPTLVANILSFVVLYLSMRGFFSSETSGQLGAVANLLIYLQMLLLLQDKTPRQYWQLMVLSFLQVVVASVFHIQLEGGLLFIVYMAFAAVFLLMLNSVNQRFTAGQQNRQVQPSALVALGFRKQAVRTGLPEIALEPGTDRPRMIFGLLGHLSSWVLACLAFATFLFVLIPRSDSPWFTGRSVTMTMPGSARKINLDERGKISLEGAQVFTAIFRRSPRGRGLQLPDPPYFRSMAYGTLAVAEGNSTWYAPYDRSYPQNWLPAEANPAPVNSLLCRIRQEASTDSTLQTVEPICSDPERQVRAYFSPELSALSRYEPDREIELLPFDYEFRVAVGEGLRSLDSFPYRHLQRFPSETSMEADPAEREWLTQLDAARYPGLVAIAGAEAERVTSGNPLEVCRRLERWFLEPGRFSYTLDYSRVPRQPGLDSVEDFVVNHRSGHCEMFASALAIMLRSRGIPCRYVVGYYGGSYVEREQAYRVAGLHAHAWVEAYIPPEFITPDRIESGAALPGGAWLRLDSTPPSALRDQAAGSGNAIDLARDLWSDYVLNLESNRQISWSAFASQTIAGMLDLSNWSNALKRADNELRTRPAVYLALVLPALLMLGVAFWFRIFRKPSRTGPASSRSKLSGFRRVLGLTFGLISPGLARWIRGESEQGVWFFEKFNQLLEKKGQVRLPHQTYVEFAGDAARALSGDVPQPPLSPLLLSLTQKFQAIRFGGEDLQKLDRAEIDRQLAELEQILSADPREATATVPSGTGRAN